MDSISYRCSSKLLFLYLFLFLLQYVHGEKAHHVDLDKVDSTGRTSRDLFLEGTKRYQKSKVNAKATFTAPGLDSQATFVTNIVNFTSTDENVASFNGSILSGVSPGDVRINVETSGTNTVVLDEKVSVTSAAVKVTSLSVTALTNSTVSGATVDNTTGRITPVFETQQLLEKKGDIAGVSVVANMEDGTYMDITEEATLTSNHVGLGIARDATGPLVVVLDALEGMNGPLLNANWSVFGQSGVQESISGRGRIQVSILPTSSPTPAATSPTNQPTVAVPPTSVPSPTVIIAGGPTSLPTPYIPYVPTGAPTISALPTSPPTSNTTDTRAPAVSPTSAPSMYLPVNASIPTTVPTSSAPTQHMPTSMPTAFGTIGLELAKLHPDILLTQSGSGPIPHKNKTYLVATMDLSASFSRPYGAVFNQKPGSSGGFKIRFAGIDYGSSTYTISKYPPGWIQGVVKTDVLYYTQDALGVTYQVRDTKGSSQVNTNGLVVSMLITNDDTGVTSTVNCNSPNGNTGLGSCEYSMSGSGWFSELGDVPIAIELLASSPLIPGVQYIVSPLYHSVLKKKPSYKALGVSDEGMIATVPQYPKLPGSHFSVPVTGYSGGTSAIVTWVVTIVYDNTVLAHVSTETSNLYTTAVESFPDSRTIRLSAAGLGTGVVPADVTGADILMFTLNWEVLSGAAPFEYSDAITVYVDSFVNFYTIKFYGDSYAQVNGEIDTTVATSTAVLESGQVTVHNTTENGILSYALQNELINDATLTGANVSSPISVIGVQNHVDVSDISLDNYANCQLGDARNATVLLLEDCNVILMNSHKDGGTDLPVVVDFNGYTDQLRFHIWQYLKFELTAADYKLNLIY